MKINRKIQPEIKSNEIADFKVPEKVILDNGLPMYVINAGTQDVCRIELIFNAGTAYQNFPLSSRFTNKLLTEGTLKYKAYEIASIFEYYGAYISTSVSKDTAGIYLSIPNSKVNHVLPLLEDIVKNSVFPEQEFSLLINNSRQEFIDDSMKVSQVAANEFNEMIFGVSHPYGKKAVLDDFDKITVKNIEEFYRKFYSSLNCFIILSGKIDNKLLKLLNKHFGGNDWCKNYNNDFKLNFPKNNDEATEKYIEMPGKCQSAIRIGKVLFNKNHRDYAKFSVVNTILGGYFGSRLMKNIREDKGYTYGIYSTNFSLKNSGLFVITTEVGSNHVNNTITEIYNEINKLKDETINENELNTVKSYMLGKIMQSLDGPFATANTIRNIIELNLDFKPFITNFVENVLTTTNTDINTLTNKYLDEKELTKIIVGLK